MNIRGSDKIQKEYKNKKENRTKVKTTKEPQRFVFFYQYPSHSLHVPPQSRARKIDEISVFCIELITG